MNRYVFLILLPLFPIFVSAQDQDTLKISVDDFTLQEVSVSARRASTVKSRTTAIDTQKMNADELCKAACCNLSESFETNASVDVAYSDAATGAKQIRLLGLQGTYVQLLTENTPGIRGLAQQFGLEYVPGSWMESIQVSKGTASVINGYEATTGQINIEYLKPKTADPLAINLMLNSELNTEVNLTGGWQVKQSDADVSTALLAHGQLMPMNMDMNKDGFVDMPMGYNANVLNRWDIFRGNYTGRILVRGLYDKRIGGQQNSNIFKQTASTDPLYLIDLGTWRIDGFMKNGYVIDEEKEMSIGIITALSHHNQSNTYGNRLWQAAQTNAYLNAMFAMEASDGHKITTGLSVNYDKYTEQLQLTDSKNDLGRQEVTPGLFAEYSFHQMENLSLLAGMRIDYSSRYGVFFTPRMNIRYSPWEWWNIRASLGMGYRSPNIIADNAFVLPSSREIILPDKLNQEKALNAGVSTTFYIPIASKELQLSLEYYYTNFFDCLITDLDTDPHKVIFSNLGDGRAFAQSAQAEASMEVLRGWTITAAFRYTDVRQTINGKLREKPLTPRFKGLITTSYSTPLKKWQFDVTAQFNGGGRMPDPDPEKPLWESNYKWYPQLMAQVTKYWRTCSLYLGAENVYFRCR